MVKLQAFLEEQREMMLVDLERIVLRAKQYIETNPEDYQSDYDEPTIDVRLCVDLSAHSGPNWIFRTGSVDYDPYISEYCSASLIGLNTKAEDLLNELSYQLE